MTRIARLNPPQLPVNPAFSQGVSVEAPVRTVYVGGQNAVTADGAIVGDDVGTQTAAALAILEHVLAAGGARLEDVVSWSISLVQGQPLAAACAAFQRTWGTRADPRPSPWRLSRGSPTHAFSSRSAIAAVWITA